ncbi:MAG TPA: MFS transporter [Firmicutes bacterium]|jgi:EmrB/QacA subfamily drug resistance transporter|nr:MFS transporter [Bacillota bacterium]
MEQQEQTGNYTILFTVVLGTMLAGYVSSCVNIALINIMQNFGFTMDSVVWVTLAYMLPYGSTLPITGRLGDLFGRKRMYLLGLGIFTVATLFVGLAWSKATLILFRVFQGMGAGLLYPNSMALTSDAFPANKRGQALGLWGALSAAGSALGPTIGGYIVEYMNWHLIFYSILPIAIIGLFLGLKILPESKEENASSQVDYLGGILLVVCFSCLLIALNQGNKNGWASAYIVGLFTGSALSLLAFVFVESLVAMPMIDLQLFKNFTFTISNTVGFLSYIGMYGASFLMPFYMRNIQRFPAIKAGVCLLPLPMAMVLFAPLGGRMADKLGSRILASIGMAVMGVALFSFHFLNDRTSYPTMAWGLIVMGVGLAFTMSPLSNGVMGVLPKDKLGVGSGVFNLFKNIGGAVGVALMGTLLDSRLTFHSVVFKNNITIYSNPALHGLKMFQSLFIKQGYSKSDAGKAALTMLQSLITKQAAIATYQDVFLVVAVLCALGVIPALFIKDSKKKV